MRRSRQIAGRTATVVFTGIAVVFFPRFAVSGNVNSENAIGLPEYGAAFPKMTRSLSKRDLALINEYRQNYAKLRNFYGNVQIEAVVRRSNFKARKTEQNPDGKTTAKLNYRSNGNKLFRIDDEALNWDTEESLGKMWVHVAGPESTFSALKSNPENSLAITQVFANRAELVEKGPLLQYSMLLRAPFSCLGEPNLDEIIFSQPNWPVSEWRISRVEQAEENPSLVSIYLDAAFKNEGAADQRMELKFTFFRDLTWALESSSFGPKTLQSDADYVRLARFQYDRGTDDLPLLKNATYWVERGPDRKRSNEEVFEVTSFIPEPAEVDSFLPEAVGLSLSGTKANWSVRIIIFIIGLALLFAYFRLKRQSPA